jgi:hypothetical protein
MAELDIHPQFGAELKVSTYSGTVMLDVEKAGLTTHAGWLQSSQWLGMIRR